MQQRHCWHCGLKEHRNTDSWCPRPRSSNARINNMENISAEDMNKYEETIADNRPSITHYHHTSLSTVKINNCETTGSTLFQLPILVQQGHIYIQAKGLKDDGAIHNFISRKFVQKNHLKISNTHQQVQIIHPNHSKQSAPIQY